MIESTDFMTSIQLADNVKHIVSQTLAISIDKIESRKRTKELVDARRILCMLLKEKLALGLAEIGTFVNRDHSNIVHYIKGHDDMIRWEVDYRKKYNACKLIADEVIKNEVVERFDPESQLQKALQYIEELKEENEKLKGKLDRIYGFFKKEGAI
jgi:hypothetical protein